jgi:hypothetical protein
VTKGSPNSESCEFEASSPASKSAVLIKLKFQVRFIISHFVNMCAALYSMTSAIAELTLTISPACNSRSYSTCLLNGAIPTPPLLKSVIWESPGLFTYPIRYRSFTTEL